MLHSDGTLHLSDLKKFGSSAAHYLDSIKNPIEATRPMRIGTIVDKLVFGLPLPPVWEKTRRGKEWEAFKAAHPGEEIVTQGEVDDARPIAEATLKHPMARRFLDGSKYQVALKWEMFGIPCSTRGVDIVGDGWICDLKTTKTTQPDRWLWQARSMHYDAQLAFYAEGCRQNGIDVSKGLYLLGVESSSPYDVVAIRMTERAVEMANAKISVWLDQLRSCMEANEWPGYVQSEIEMDAPDEMTNLVGFENDDEAAE